MSTLNWFKQALPNPTATNFTVQLGCHLEELVETLEALVMDSDDRQNVVTAYEAIDSIKRLANSLKVGSVYVAAVSSVDEMIDGLADQHVTLTGLAHIVNLDFDGAKAEVDRSNFSKFVDGKAIFNENGKIAKGPDYTPPNLEPFIPAVEAQVIKLFG